MQPIQDALREQIVLDEQALAALEAKLQAVKQDPNLTDRERSDLIADINHDIDCLLEESAVRERELAELAEREEYEADCRRADAAMDALEERFDDMDR
jgi:uncharacterized membrane protein YukC